MTAVRVLLTGSSSLLGRSVVAKLLAGGHSVTVLQRRPARLAGVEEILGSVADPRAVRRAVAGCDTVVHIAARVGIVGSWPEFAETNIVGTRVLIDAAAEAGVTRVVHVSSPSVAHSGSALVGAEAGPANPGTARGHYAKSKAEAELIALGANSPSMSVVAVRPHLIWGPGDTQLVGRIVERARRGRLAYVGSGAALIDSTFITNAADALIAAIDRAEFAAGEALVVSNGEPRPIGELVDRIVVAHGLAPPRLRVPRPVAFAGGWVAERAWRSLRLSGEPPMTTFLAGQLGTAHWFDQRRTREVLGWTPQVSIDEGLAMLAAAHNAAVAPGGAES